MTSPATVHIIIRRSSDGVYFGVTVPAHSCLNQALTLEISLGLDVVGMACHEYDPTYQRYGWTKGVSNERL